MEVYLKNDKEKKLERLEKAYNEETNEHKKRQLETKLFDFKRKHFPKMIFNSNNGKTYRHY